MFDFNLRNGKENLRIFRQVLDGPYNNIRIVGISKERFLEHLKTIRTEHLTAETDPELWDLLVGLENGTSTRLALRFDEKIPMDSVSSQLLDVLAPFNKNRMTR